MAEMRTVAPEQVEAATRSYVTAIYGALYEASLIKRGPRQASSIDVEGALDALATVSAMLIEAMPAMAGECDLRARCAEAGRETMRHALALRSAFERDGVRLIDGSVAQGKRAS